MPLFAQVICAASGRDVRGEFGFVIVKRFFKGAKGVDDAVCKWSGVSGLADVVEGVISTPFVDDQVVVGCDDAGDRDAIGEQVVCDFLFNGEQVVWFAARERCKEVMFYSPGLGEGFDFCNALLGQFVAEQMVNVFGHGLAGCFLFFGTG